MSLNKKQKRLYFKESVFKRDNYRCVVCFNKAVDAHHIIDRSLWKDGGYYLDNGVSLCEECHLKAENEIISCEELRKAAEITNVLLPEGFNKKFNYSRWGKIL